MKLPLLPPFQAYLNPLLAVATSLLLLTSAGCAVNPVPTPEKSTASETGTDTPSFGVDTMGSLDTASSLDTFDPGGGDSAAADSGKADSDDAIQGSDSSDAGGDSAIQPWICDLPGEPGCPCAENGVCASGHCIDTPNLGKICTDECKAGCPNGYACIAQGATDLIYLCMPKWPVLCNPCDADADCAAVGAQKALCVDRGPLGFFCGAGCSSDSDCPGGYQCGEAKSADGKTAMQCMPAPGVDGPSDCSCTAAAVSAALGTSCTSQAVDAGGKVLGSCKGVRQCGAEGLSKCSAVIEPETCNGKDDDCDGALDEGACDDSNPCTTDACDAVSMACAHSPTSGSCDADGNACTVGDECLAGKCTAGPVKKCDDANPCTLDSCDMASGCTASDDNGIGCDDGDGCSVGDTCKGGQCVPGKAKLCPTGKLCQVVQCDSASGQCQSKAQPDGAGCDDGTACTQADSCKDGACLAKPLDCNDNNPCTLDTCDSASGCGHASNEAPCDDGNACTGPDLCAKGSCVGLAKSASACDDGNVCTNDACDPKDGCVITANMAPCQDGNPCTTGDQCKDKQCVGGTSTCQCQKDSDCADDGNLCNGTPFCDKSTANYACKTNPATVVKCDIGGDSLCAVNTCAPISGKCALVWAADGKPCDADGSICSAGDACKGGKCLPGATLNCNDGNPCTNDACDPKAGCSHVNNSAACDADGSLCTDKDTCSAGKCVAGSALKCDDANPCTSDSCAPAKGCQYGPETDGTECGLNKGCKAGVCEQLAYCGDKIVSGIEQCDDGNTVSGDGCSATCNLETAAPPLPGELVVTEIMVNPAGSIQEREWAELHNPTNKPLLLGGLWYGDVDFSYQLPAGLVIGPGAYVVIAASGFTATNSGVSPIFTYKYLSGEVAFNNNADGVCITYKATGKCDATATAVVKYDTGASGWPTIVAGKSLQLSADKISTAASKLGASWCLGKTPFGTGGDYGTPGKPNSSCP